MKQKPTRSLKPRARKPPTGDPATSSGNPIKSRPAVDPKEARDPISSDRSTAESLRALEDEIRMLEEKVRTTARESAGHENNGAGDLNSYSQASPGKHEAEMKAPMPAQAPKVGRELTLRDIFFMVRERWMLGLAVGILVAGGFAYWSLTRPAVYRATAEMLIELQGNRALPEDLQKLDEEFVGAQGNAVQQAMRVHEKNFESAAFKAMVRDSLTPRERLAYTTPLQEEDPGIGKGHVPDEFKDLSSAELLQSHFGSGLTILRDSREAQFVDVSYDHPDPRVAQLVANRFVKTYNDFIKRDSQEIHQDAQVFLDARIDELEKSIEKQERDLLTYRKQHGIMDEEESGESPKLANLTSTITSLNLEILDREAELEKIKAFRGDALELATVPSVAEIEQVALQLKRLEENDEEYARLSARYLERHPKMITNRSTRESILAAVRASVQVAVTELESQLDRRKAQLESLQAEMKTATAELMESKDPYVEFRVMQKQIELDREQYSQLLQRRNDSRIVGLLDSARIKEIRPAMMPRQPLIPDRPKILKLSAVIFLGCLIGLPVGIGFFDTRLKSFSEAEAFLGKECLGVVAEKRGTMTEDLGIGVLQDLDNEFTEAFRVIYTTIDLSSKEPYPKVMLITSSSPGEGKSTIAANLGAMFARHRKRVLIVDGDFRKPSQHKYARAKNSAGLLRFLRSPDHVIPKTAEDLGKNEDLGLLAMDESHQLYLLRAGGQTRNPSEIVDNEDFEQLFDVLRNVFDLIIIDTPPVGLFPDALLLSRYAEETLFVCKHNGVNRHKIKFALTKMENSGSHVLGTVMNQMSTSRRHHYGYGYQDYGYGYYGSKDYAKYYSDER